MDEQRALGYKGYRLIDAGQPGASHLVSPTGVKLAIFQRYLGDDPTDVVPLVDGLTVGSKHRSEEHMIRHVVDQYERITKDWWQRNIRGVPRKVVGWFVTAVTLAAGLATIVTFLATAG